MKVIDCFIYFDEDLLLDLRLNLLNSIVDKFVIVESKITHSGKNKDLQFDISKFEKFKNKISYHALENMNVDENIKLKKNWSKFHLVDQSIRNSIANFISFASEDDWIIISDLDEIPNPEVITKFDKKRKYGFFEQGLYNYKFNLKNITEPFWYGSRICVKKHLKSPQWLRNFKIKKNQNLIKKLFYNFQILKNGGWHFNSIKSPKDLIRKFKSFAHSEMINNQMLNIDFIENKISNYEHILNDKVILNKVDLDSSFPEYLLKNKQKFKEFII